MVNIEDLIEVTKEEAFVAFPNRAVYFIEENSTTIQYRCWWDKVDGSFHNFPHNAIKYYLKPKIYPCNQQTE